MKIQKPQTSQNSTISSSPIQFLWLGGLRYLLFINHISAIFSELNKGKSQERNNSDLE